MRADEEAAVRCRDRAARRTLMSLRPVLDQEEWPREVVEKPGPEIILSVANINKASFLGSFRVTVSHEVRSLVLFSARTDGRRIDPIPENAQNFRRSLPGAHRTFNVCAPSACALRETVCLQTKNRFCV